MNSRDYVRWVYLRWRAPDSGREPDLSDLSVGGIEVELYLSNEPTVQMLRKMELNNFAMESVSYRLEAIVMFALAFTSLVCAITINLAKEKTHYTSLTEQQELQLSRIDEENPRLKQL